jgi:hypothetical protein
VVISDVFHVKSVAADGAIYNVSDVFGVSALGFSNINTEIGALGAFGSEARAYQIVGVKDHVSFGGERLADDIRNEIGVSVSLERISHNIVANEIIGRYI